MWKIPIVKNGPAPEVSDQSLADLHSLPVFYMGDYSVIGILVDRIDEATAILRSNGYAVECKKSGCFAEIETSRGVGGLLDLLRVSGISSELGDVVGGIYRG